MTEWDAVGYSRRSSLQEAMDQEVFALLDLNGSERILDVGCGDGKITAEIALRVPGGSVVGVDPSRDMISFAQSHHNQLTKSKLRFELGDARTLSFQREFGLVVSFNALHWVPEQHAALRSIRSALISGGKAQIRLVPAGARQSLEDVVEETRDSSRWTLTSRIFTILICI
jgi:trans-aconitate 2-methyltransferase